MAKGMILAAGQGTRVRPLTKDWPKPMVPKSSLASSGIPIFEPQVLDRVPSGVEPDIGSQLFALLAKTGFPFYARRHLFNSGLAIRSTSAMIVANCVGVMPGGDFLLTRPS